MDDWYETIFDLVGDRSAIVLAAIVFLSVAGLAFLVMAGVHSRSAVKRRAAGINAHSGTQPAGDQRAATIKQQGSATNPRLRQQALCGPARRVMRKCCGTGLFTRVFSTSEGLRSFLWRARLALSAAACSGVVFRVAALGSTRRFGFLASRVGRRSPGISGAGALHQPTDFDATCRASHWISGFHGFAGGLR